MYYMLYITYNICNYNKCVRSKKDRAGKDNNFQASDGIRMILVNMA